MRIIAGQYRGRRLQRPEILSTRPTSDRVRESLFNILAHGILDSFEGLAVLDAFGGSGALAFEALSRGAGRAYIWDTHFEALKILKENARALSIESFVKISNTNALRPLKALAPVDLVFLDPPYGEGLIPKTLVALGAMGWIGSETVVVAEVEATEILDIPHGFMMVKERVQGPARLVFMRIS